MAFVAAIGVFLGAAEGTVAAVALGSAVTGAVVGAVTAAVKGGDILKGALVGGVLGGAGGAIAGAAGAGVGAASSTAPVAASEGLVGAGDAGLLTGGNAVLSPTLATTAATAGKAGTILGMSPGTGTMVGTAASGAFQAMGAADAAEEKAKSDAALQQQIIDNKRVTVAPQSAAAPVTIPSYDFSKQSFITPYRVDATATAANTQTNLAAINPSGTATNLAAINPNPTAAKPTGLVAANTTPQVS